MKPNAIVETIQLADGREITIETGRLAKQADGSVVVRMLQRLFRDTTFVPY